MRRSPHTPRRLISVLSAIGLMTGLFVALVPAGAAQATGGPVGGFVIPAGSVAKLTNAEFSSGAVNNLSWGYQLNGDPNVVLDNNLPGTEVYPPDRTLGPYQTDRTLLVFLQDDTCNAIFYSDGTPVDHVTVTGSNPYSMDFFDAGGSCESATSDRHEAGVFNFRVDLAISCAASAPDAPTNVQAFGGDQSAAISWDMPTNDGGAPIESYTVNIYDQSVEGSSSIQTTDASTSAQIGGLTNGDTYAFTAQATNCAGTGPASAESNAVTPATGTSAEVIGPGNLSQSTGTPPPTATDTTVGAQVFPTGTTGIGTLEELSAGSTSLAIQGAVSVDQFCAPSACIGNVLQAELHDGSLGGASYKIKLFIDSTLVTGPVTDFKVWYDGNLLDDSTVPDPTPPVTLSHCIHHSLTTPCISRRYLNKTGDLKILVKSSDLDPRMSTSK